MYRCLLSHSSDGLRAFLAVSLDDDRRYPDENELCAFIRHYGIVYGLDENKLHEMLARKIYNTRVEIARGLPPRPGVDARIEMLVDVSGAGKPRERADGGVDHRDLKFAVNVRKGQALARRIPPVPGTDGIDVYGRQIKVPPLRNVMLRMGAGTALAEDDPDLLVANIDGAVVVNPNGLVEVKTDKIVHGDIDYSTGSIVFAGELTINGTVRGGFKVATEGDLVIIGNVEEAKVSSKGSIEIKGGASSAGKGRLESGKTIRVRYIENFTAQAREDILVAEDAIHCRLSAGNGIRARSIVGGTVSPGNMLDVENLGNNAEVKTVIDIEGQYKFIREREKHAKRLVEMTESVRTVRNEMFDIVCENMNDDGWIVADGVENTLDELKEKIKACEDEMFQVNERIEELNIELKNFKIPELKVRRLFPNTIVRHGPVEKIFKEPMSNVVIRLDQDKIAVMRT